MKDKKKEMMNFNDAVKLYQEQLQKGTILVAYSGLVKFMRKLQSVFSKNLANKYSFGKILPGYMDYTYFYFSNDFLKEKKLKCGFVLNHIEMRFEIWLLGQTVDIQKKYWTLLKKSKWNIDRTEMPKYSVLEAVIEDNPNFNDLNELSQRMEEQLILIADEIIDSVKRVEN